MMVVGSWVPSVAKLLVPEIALAAITVPMTALVQTTPQALRAPPSTRHVRALRVPVARPAPVGFRLGVCPCVLACLQLIKA